MKGSMMLRYPIPTLLASLAVGSLLGGLLGGCTANKAGGGVVPQTVVLATGDSEGTPASDDVLHFAAAVKKLSGGAITVDVRWEAHEAITGPDDQQPYATVAEYLESGEAELALVPDFVWVDRGAHRMAALKAPFLITSDSEVNAIVGSPIAGDMLAELMEFGVHGLALLPDSLRHPAGFDKVFTTLRDFDGATLRTLDSQSAKLFQQWGARAVPLNGLDYPQAVFAGEVQGVDAAFARVTSSPAGTFTGDITLFPKINALVASNSWFDGLGADEKRILTDAAQDTLEYVIATTPSDAQSAKDYCSRGGSVVLAGRDAVAELERAAEPLQTALRSDSRTRAAIQAIVELKADVENPTERVAACGESTSPPKEPPAPVGTQNVTFPEGTYRMEISKQAFLDAGVDAGTAADHTGVWTITFRDGVFADPGCPGGSYAVHDERVWVTLGAEAQCGDPAGKILFSARWTYQDDVLRFIDVRSEAEGPLAQSLHETLWGSVPWQRIG